jgi:hypothetical protein
MFDDAGQSTQSGTRSLILARQVRTFALRQTPQRQAGEASVRGSAEEAPEGHWGVLHFTLASPARSRAPGLRDAGAVSSRGTSTRNGWRQNRIHPE